MTAHQLLDRAIRIVALSRTHSDDTLRDRVERSLQSFEQEIMDDCMKRVCPGCARREPCKDGHHSSGEKCTARAIYAHWEQKYGKH